MINLAAQIAERRCPHCLKEGTLRLQMAHASVVCISCLRSFINPFWEGPWDNQDRDKIIIDSVNGDVVSSYSAKAVEEPVEEAEIEKAEAWADFYRYLQERETSEGE